MSPLFVVIQYEGDTFGHSSPPPRCLGAYLTLEGARESLEPIRRARHPHWTELVERLDGMGFSIYGRNISQRPLHVLIQEVGLLSPDAYPSSEPSSDPSSEPQSSEPQSSEPSAEPLAYRESIERQTCRHCHGRERDHEGSDHAFESQLGDR
jgi:hypothetical protein